MVADTEVDMVTKKVFNFHLLGVGSLLGGLFWCRADLGYFPPNLFWMGGNYPEGGFWLFSAPFAVNRGKLQFPPRQRAVFTRGLYIGVKILIWRNATVLLINDRSDNCILFFLFSSWRNCQTSLQLPIEKPGPLCLCLELGGAQANKQEVLGFKEEIRLTPKSSSATSWLCLQDSSSNILQSGPRKQKNERPPLYGSGLF